MCLIPNLDREPRLARLQFACDAEGRCVSRTVLPVSEASEPADTQRYRWTGREWDAETRLVYHRTRCYDPSVGRWIGADPLGYGPGDGDHYPYWTAAESD